MGLGDWGLGTALWLGVIPFHENDHTEEVRTTATVTRARGPRTTNRIKGYICISLKVKWC
jgi:hypothetical protein